MRADVVYSWFKKWLSPSVPVIRLTFNQPVTKDSVAKSLFIIDANTIGKEYVLNVDRDPDDQEIPKVKNGVEARRIWLVTPKDELPLDKEVSLKIKAGLVSAFGEERGIVNREIVLFRTFPAFKFLGVKCKNNDDKDIIFSPNQEQKDLCDPISDVYLSFSSPVLRSQIGNNITFNPAINLSDGSDSMWNNGDYSHLNEAHQAGKAYDIRLPRAIKPDTLYQIKNKNYGKQLCRKLLIG
jgi:alpha-2-macroglobulin